MAKNENLKSAKTDKNDEFYTQLSDIENELKYYKSHFKGKTVFCNCDDPYESNFFKYFALNFNHLGLKKLIAVSYAGSPVACKEMGLFEEEGEEYTISNKRAYKVTMIELKDVTGDGRVDLDDVRELIKHRIRYLKGDGSFDSEESIALLKEADIVVTNPPFSRFRDYIAQLMEYDKKFIVIGNQNALTYKEIFPLIQNNRIWWGASDCVRWFLIPDNVEMKHKLNASGKRIAEGARSRWFTNLDHSKRHEPLDLYKRYDSAEYPKFDNYDAINVEKTVDIPMDYDGIMGVPITFLDKYCPEQFEIIGMSKSPLGNNLRTKVYDKQIQHSLKKGEHKTSFVTKLNDGGSIKCDSTPNKDVYYEVNGEYYVAVFPRILIRKKAVNNANQDE